MNEVQRSYNIPGESSKDIVISYKQALFDIANAYEMKEEVIWSTEVEEETPTRYGVVCYTVVIIHDEGSTSFNWTENL